MEVDLGFLKNKADDSLALKAQHKKMLEAMKMRIAGIYGGDLDDSIFNFKYICRCNMEFHKEIEVLIQKDMDTEQTKSFKELFKKLLDNADKLGMIRVYIYEKYGEDGFAHWCKESTKPLTLMDLELQQKKHSWDQKTVDTFAENIGLVNKI